MSPRQYSKRICVPRTLPFACQWEKLLHWVPSVSRLSRGGFTNILAGWPTLMLCFDIRCNVNQSINISTTVLTGRYRVYTAKNAFSGQIYENKVSVSEIPT